MDEELARVRTASSALRRAAAPQRHPYSRYCVSWRQRENDERFDSQEDAVAFYRRRDEAHVWDVTIWIGTQVLTGWKS